MLTQDFPPMPGGIAAHVYELSKRLIKMGHEVVIITPTNKECNNNETIIDGMTVYRVPKIKVPKLRTYYYSYKALNLINNLLKQKEFDIFHYHNLLPESIYTKKLTNYNLIFTAHESFFLKLFENEKNYKRLRWYLSHPDWIIGPSEELVSVAVKLGYPQNKTTFIPNGVDIDKFNPNVKKGELRKKLNIDSRTKIILSTRRLVEKNGVEYLIKAIPHVKHKDIKVVLVGDGPEKNKLIQLAKQLNLNDLVVFMGTIQNDKLPEIYADSDIVVLPSLKEATSISGLEAMASGKALIGTKVGGIPYLIDNEITGLIVEPRNPVAIADAIDKILSNNLDIQYGLNARKKVEEKFSWEVIAKETEKVYLGVLENKNGRWPL
jgi:glycosyltransferase involved in cell wall biosynthesis